MAIVAAMRAKPSFRSFTLGGSSGMVVSSGSLDGPRVHRSADSAWIEPSVDGHVKPTGAEMVRTVCCARLSVAWALDGSAVPRESDGCKHSLTVGRGAPGRWSVSHSQRIGEDDQPHDTLRQSCPS